MATSRIRNSNGVITQDNKGDTQGGLWATFNCDLSTTPGKLKVSKKMVPTLSEAKMDNDRIHALAIFGGKILGFGTGGRYVRIEANRNLRLSGNWTSSAPVVSDVGNETDAIVYDGKILVSTGANIASATTPEGTFDEDWWNTVTIGGELGPALDINVPHTLDVSKIGKETIFVTNGNLVHYANTAAGHSTVTLPTTHTACALTTNYQATWAGTYTNSGKALVYEIHVGETLDSVPIARNAYELEGTACLSLETIDGVVYAVTDWGHIQAFNGTGFVTVASFPFAHDGVTLAGLSLGNISDANTERAIHPKGMKKYSKSLMININTNNQLIVDLAGNPTDNDDIFENVVVNERSASGVWEYNTETGVLNHRYSFTNADTQHGYQRHTHSGPLLIVDNQYTRLLATAVLDSTRTDIYAESPDQTPFAYFITREIDTDSVHEAWNKIVAKINTLEVGEEVQVKYRTYKKRLYPKYSEINWMSTTTFTSTSDCSMVEVGDEVEITDGYGAGNLAHVTEIGVSATVYTFTVDTAIGLTAQTSHARFQNWKKAEIKTDGGLVTTGLDKSSEWVQLKVVLDGFIEVRDFITKGVVKTEL